MPQQPLTPTGVDLKQTELYALSDNALKIEADAIYNDFTTWVKANFILNPAQVTYLDGMDQRWIRYTGSQASFAVSNRLTIIFSAPSPLPPPTISKLAETEGKDLKAAFTQAGGFIASGTLAITITY